MRITSVQMVPALHWRTTRVFPVGRSRMNHLKSSLSTVAAVAVAIGMVACGGENRQQQANAPVGTPTESAQATPPEQNAQYGQYGSAMGQPGTSTAGSESTAPSTMGGASGQLNPQSQYGQGQTGQTGQMGQSGQYGQGTMGQSTTGSEQPGQSAQGQYGSQGTMGQSGQTGTMGGTQTPSGGTMGSTNTMGSSGMGGGTMDVSSLNDAQLAAVLQAINQGEIQSAQLAQQKAASPDVKHFARDMLNSHRSMMNEQQSTLSQAQITPSDNAVSQQLRTDAQSEQSTLEGMRGRDFDREYIDDQIKDHNKALELIDRILPNVKNPQLKTQLQNAKPKIEHHLREAERVQQKLQQGSTNQQGGTKGNDKSNEGGSQSPNGTQNQSGHQNQQNQQQNQGGSQNPY